MTVGGRAPDAEMACDVFSGPALAVQVPHLLVRLHSLLPASRSHGQRPLRRRWRVGPHRTTLGRHVLTPGLFGVPQLPGMAGKRHFQRLGRVLQQVEAVGDLHRIGRAIAACRGVGAGAITRDHLDAGVLA